MKLKRLNTSVFFNWNSVEPDMPCQSHYLRKKEIILKKKLMKNIQQKSPKSIKKRFFYVQFFKRFKYASLNKPPPPLHPPDLTKVR